MNAGAGFSRPGRFPPGGRSMKAVYKKAWGYQDDAMNLPVADVDEAVGFYETVMGFAVVSRHDAPHKSVVLARDDVQIRLAENGADPTQDGCFFEVNDAEATFAELQANGLDRDDARFEVADYGDQAFKQFFVVAPDGLCYCLGEPIAR
jgi:catechol 2,3-dioxygenase-like lactoylglutathione lyase family enzyme